MYQQKADAEAFEVDQAMPVYSGVASLGMMRARTNTAQAMMQASPPRRSTLVNKMRERPLGAAPQQVNYKMYDAGVQAYSATIAPPPGLPPRPPPSRFDLLQIPPTAPVPPSPPPSPPPQDI